MSYFQAIEFKEFIRIMFFGIRFDLSALYYFNFIFIILSLVPGDYKNHKNYQRSVFLFYVIVNSFMLATNFIDTKFFDFEHKRLTADYFSSVWLGEDFITLLPEFIKDYWYLFFMWVLVCFGIYSFYPKHQFQEAAHPKMNRSLLLKQSLIFILLMGLGLLIGRGGFQLKPLRVIHAAEYTSAKNIPLVLNSPFTIMKSIGTKSIQVSSYYSKEQLDSIFTPVIKYTHSEFKNTNVVIIILESFSKEYIGALNKGIGYTPFLDSLIGKSLSCTNAFANGKRSMEALPSIMAGLPALTDETYITSQYSLNKINTIATVLNKKAYRTAFFHGGKNGTMGFDKFAKIAGFSEYYGMNEYPTESDYDGNWGIYDEEYLQYFCSTLSEFEEPFFASVFTLTSHHPYEIPERYKGNFPKGNLNIHESIGYADYSLKKFFQAAQKTDWFENTLFIITADHTAQAESSYYNTQLGNYTIPIIFYHSSDTSLQGNTNRIAQQSDIFPSLMDYLGINDSFVCFGNSVFQNNKNRFTANYINGMYQLLNKDYLIQFDGTKTRAVYHIQSDSLLQHNIVDRLDNYQDQESLLKAIIQSYQERLVGNKLSLE